MHDRSYIIISWLRRPGNEDHGFLSSVGLEREMIRDKVETSTIVSYITMATQQTHQYRNIMNWKNCLFHLSLFKSQIINTTLHQCRFFLEYYAFIQVNPVLYFIYARGTVQWCTTRIGTYVYQTRDFLLHL